MRPFILVLFAALGVLTLKMASLYVDGQAPMQQATNTYDPIVTGTANRNAQRREAQSLPKVEMNNADVLSKAISTMNPKEAAKFFSNLDLETQSKIAPKLSATLLGDILVQLSPEKAENLTKALMRD